MRMCQVMFITRGGPRLALPLLLLLLLSSGRGGLASCMGSGTTEPRAVNLVRHKLLILSHCASPLLHWRSLECQNESSCLSPPSPCHCRNQLLSAQDCWGNTVPWLKGSQVAQHSPHYQLLHKSLIDRKHKIMRIRNPGCSCRTPSAWFSAQDPLCSTAQPKSKVSNMPQTTHPACQKINASN